jgi:hypothetical protein
VNARARAPVQPLTAGEVHEVQAPPQRLRACVRVCACVRARVCMRVRARVRACAAPRSNCAPCARGARVYVSAAARRSVAFCGAATRLRRVSLHLHLLTRLRRVSLPPSGRGPHTCTLAARTPPRLLARTPPPPLRPRPPPSLAHIKPLARALARPHPRRSLCSEAELRLKRRRLQPQPRPIHRLAQCRTPGGRGRRGGEAA